MRVGSLFSGAGGLDLALREVFDGEVAWHSEMDSAASKVLAHHYPDVPNLGDITAIDWATVQPVDILCGGFPCQDVSSAGKRAGIKAGTRSGLWAMFAEAIDQLRPPIVVIENVRGLLSAEAHRDLEPENAAMGDGSGRPVLRAAGAVLGDLADLGYDAQWTTVAASDVGAPHRRERVFILAYAAQQSGLIDDRDGLRVGGKTQRRQQDSGRSSVADTACDGRHEGRTESARFIGRPDAAQRGDGPVNLLPTPAAADAGGTRAARGGSRSNELLLNGIAQAYQRGELLPTPAASRSGNNQSASPGAAVRPSLDSITQLLPTPKARDGLNGDCPSERQRNSPGLGAIDHYLPTPRRSDGDGGANPLSRAERMDDVETRVLRLLPTHAASDATGGGRHPDARAGHTSQIIDTALLHGTPEWGKYGPAIARWESVTRPAPSPTEPNSKGNPRLAAAFSEWMMGWPAGWVTGVPSISRNDQLRIIGNGVVPQQAIAALRYLLTVSEVAA